jgi:uncharacterized membrane protein
MSLLNKKDTHIVLGLIFSFLGIQICITRWDSVHGFPVNFATGLFISILGIGLLSYGVYFGVYKENKNDNLIKNLICPECQDVKTVEKYEKIICKKCGVQLMTLDEFLAEK